MFSWLPHLEVANVIDQFSLPNIWRTLAILLVLANLKNVPLMFHTRLISSVLYHTQWNKNIVITASSHGGEAIFHSIITASRSPMYECDINGHKSDSTYFSDLDINRIHLISLLFKAAGNPNLLPSRASESLVEKPLKMRILLGGTACTFRREIKPYESYEIHSRILGWDQKWIYIVSHFVSRETLSKVGRQRQAKQEERKGTVVGRSDAIFASAISKYVFKNGRRTVLPVEALQSLRLLPEVVEKTHGDDGRDSSHRTGHWTREQIEEENKRGMEFARHFAELGNLEALFNDAVGKETFGRFSSLGSVRAE